MDPGDERRTRHHQQTARFSLMETYNALPNEVEEALCQAQRGDEQACEALGEIIRACTDAAQVATDSLDWIERQSISGIFISMAVSYKLLEVGANPLRAKKALNKHDMRHSDVFLKAIIDKEAQGMGYKTEDGGNLMHQLAYDSYVNLIMMLQGKHSHPVPYQIWINEPREDGKLPLHVAWDHHALRNPEDFWHLTGLFIDKGADLEAKDYQGISTLDAIVHAVNIDARFEGKIVNDQVRACLEARALRAQIEQPAQGKATTRRM